MSVGYLSQKKNFIQKVNEDKIDVLSFKTGNDYDGKLIQDNYGRVYKYNATTGRYESKELEIAEAASVMTKAEFEALAETRRKQYAGSGFVEWGDASNYGGFYNVINNSTMKVRSPSVLDNRFSNRMLLFREGDAKVNINGDNIILNGTGLDDNGFGTILFPQPSSAFNITDSTSLPQAMKQGDFAVLADFDRELATNGTFDSNANNWNGDYANLNYDSTNNDVQIARNSTDQAYFGLFQQINAIKGVKYNLTFDIISMGSKVSYIKEALSNKNDTLKITEAGTYEVEFIPDSSGLYTIELQGVVTDSSSNSVESTQNFVIDNITVKQVEETPIVALQDVDANIDIYANVSNFEGRDSVSAQHLVFIESWEELITDKDFVYPFGNASYSGNDVDGLTGIAEGTFEGADTYSLFSDSWQQPGDLVGKGYVWSNLSDEEKITLASNPDHNIYKEGNNWVQVRYRVRVIKGLGNDWETFNEYLSPFLTSLRYKSGYYIGKHSIGQDFINNANISIFNGSLGINNQYNGIPQNGLFKDRYSNDYIIPIALVQRRNQGIYHPTYNPEGCALTAYDSSGNGTKMVKWYELPDSQINSLQDCFNPDKIAIYKLDSQGNATVTTLSNQDGTYWQTGLIESQVSGRPDGIYANEVNERDVEDLRMDAKKKVFKQGLDENLNKAITGKLRGKEKLAYLINSNTLSDKNNWGRWYDDINSVNYKSNKSCTYNSVLTQTDIIGDPRSLQDRIQYTVDSNETITLDVNEYLLCNDSTNNKGTKGHLYRWLGESISIDTNSSDSSKNANVEGGKIDFSDDSYWVDLGSDLTIGGYPQEWIDKGFAGTPLIVGEEGESLLPVDAQTWKLSKKLTRGLKYLATKKDGSIIDVTTSINTTNNTISVTTDYSDLGYASEQEMLDLMKVIVTYETKADNTEVADNSEVLELKDEAIRLGYYNIANGTLLVQNLINKIGTDNTENARLYGQSSTLLNYRKGFYDEKLSTNWGTLENAEIPNLSAPSNNSPAVKVIPYLTQHNNRAYLQFVFKEMKYDSSSNTWGDDNTFQIVDEVSTTTDNNGKTVLIGQKRIPLNFFIAEE